MGKPHHGAKRGGPFRLSRCPDCGKWRYRSRKEARAANRTYHPNDLMTTYQCGDFWHYGHPPPEPDWKGNDGRDREPLPPTAIAQMHAMGRREEPHGHQA